MQEQQPKKQNLTLILALVLPLLLIIGVALSIYIPNLAVHPKYNFIYSDKSQTPYNCNYYDYDVQDGRIVRQDIVMDLAPELKNTACKAQYNARLYLYDVTAEKSAEISFDQAKTYTLDPSAKSPDGFEIVPGSRSDFIFSSYSDYNSRYIKGHGAHKKLNLHIYNDYYYNFDFLGWIIK